MKTNPEFLTLNKLRELLEKENIDIKKYLGQNFLIDRNARDKIVSLLNLKNKDIVVEIGPGLGELTELLVEKARKVYVFEIDKKFCSILSKRFMGFKNLHILENDFLKSDENFWNSLSEVKVIGNTPYYISSPIVLHLLKFYHKIKLALLTVQKEVGERFVGKCGSKNYGIISVLLSIYSDTKICYSLKKNLFYPMPKVDSVVIKMIPYSKPKIEIKNEKKFWDFLPLIFSYRRKKISNVVNKLFHLNKLGFEKMLREKGIPENIRVEQLPPDKIYQVFEIINSSR